MQDTLSSLKTFFGSWLLRSLIVVAVTLGGFYYIIDIVSQSQNASIDRLALQINTLTTELRTDLRQMRDPDGRMSGIQSLDEKIDRNFSSIKDLEGDFKVSIVSIQAVRQEIVAQMQALAKAIELIDPAASENIQNQAQIYSAAISLDLIEGEFEMEAAPPINVTVVPESEATADTGENTEDFYDAIISKYLPDADLSTLTDEQKAALVGIATSGEENEDDKRQSEAYLPEP